MTFSEDLSSQGDRTARNWSELIMRFLYAVGPPAIVVAALAVVVKLWIDDGAWQAFKGFTAFFIPVVLGAYVLRRFPDWLRQHIRADERMLTFIVPFMVVLLVGGALVGEFNTTKWTLGLAFLGLIIAVLFMVRIVDQPIGTPPPGASINLAALDIIVAVVTAAGLIVLFLA